MDEINYPREVMGRIMRINRLHRSVIEKRFKELGLHRTQHMMLVFIARSEDAVSQKVLAEQFDISPAAVAMSLKKMEKNGLIERESDMNDSRIKIIKVSEKGLKALEETKELFWGLDTAALSGISEDMLSRTLHTLCLISENLVSLGAVDEAPMHCKKRK